MWHHHHMVCNSFFFSLVCLFRTCKTLRHKKLYYLSWNFRGIKQYHATFFTAWPFCSQASSHPYDWITRTRCHLERCSSNKFPERRPPLFRLTSCVEPSPCLDEELSAEPLRTFYPQRPLDRKCFKYIVGSKEEPITGSLKQRTFLGSIMADHLNHREKASRRQARLSDVLLNV